MKTSTSESLRPEERIRSEASALGFDAVGIAKADLAPETSQRLMSFVELNRHGDMEWLDNRKEQRAHPRSLWPEAKSVVMLGVNYGPDDDPLEALNRKSAGVISVYAQNRDYHDVVKKRLKRLARFMTAEFGGDVKVFVDTAPVMEKPLSERAGNGWQGKHTNLVSREFGSWLFLGAVFTTLELSADAPETNHCGSCRNCLDICPTDAFPAPYQLDARRCISYLTIEHKGPIPHEFREAMGNRIYGCDDCLAVCPWNKFARKSSEVSLQPREDLKAPALAELASLDDGAFRKKFSGSPIKRTGRARFLRNVLIAIGNSNDSSLTGIAARLLDDESPLVRGAAVWALYRLSPEEWRAAITKRMKSETNESVLDEWRWAASALDA
jgi:epoxyqueuosine reductase